VLRHLPYSKQLLSRHTTHHHTHTTTHGPRGKAVWTGATAAGARQNTPRTYCISRSHPQAHSQHPCLPLLRSKAAAVVKPACRAAQHGAAVTHAAAQPDSRHLANIWTDWQCMQRHNGKTVWLLPHALGTFIPETPPAAAFGGQQALLTSWEGPWSMGGGEQQERRMPPQHQCKQLLHCGRLHLLHCSPAEVGTAEVHQHNGRSMLSGTPDVGVSSRAMPTCT
jgi:hypothetical protein